MLRDGQLELSTQRKKLILVSTAFSKNNSKKWTCSFADSSSLVLLNFSDRATPEAFVCALFGFEDLSCADFWSFDFISLLIHWRPAPTQRPPPRAHRQAGQPTPSRARALLLAWLLTSLLSSEVEDHNIAFRVSVPRRTVPSRFVSENNWNTFLL